MYQRLTFVPPDCAAWSLGAEEDLNIATVSRGIFPFLAGLSPPFEEEIY